MKNQDLKNYFETTISYIKMSKKYILIYLLFMLFFIFSFFKLDNYINPKAEIILISLITFIGIICIAYSFKNKNSLYKVAFITIFLFGLLIVFINPVLIAYDEHEHFTRSEMILLGNLNAEKEEQQGFKVTNLCFQLIDHREETFLNNNLIHEKIDNKENFSKYGFPQNPFYGYILTSLGILIAKLLDLTVIWTMWLGRFFNLLLYSIISAYAIKKSPVYKMELLVVSCLPLALFQGASFSTDSLIFSFSILSISYLIFMYKSPTVKLKEIVIFFMLIFFISLFRFPYGLLSFLIFLIPKEKFQSKRLWIAFRLIPILIMIVCMSYSLFYGAPSLEETYRAEYFIERNVNPSKQIENLFKNPLNSIVYFLNSFKLIPHMIIDIFRFSHSYWDYSSPLLSNLYLIFFTSFSLFYPHKVNFKKSDKLLIIAIMFLIYESIIFIQYLSWAPVGYDKLDMIIGVNARYYIPLLIIFPSLFDFQITENKSKNIDLKVLLIVITFLSGSLILTTSIFY